MITIRTRLKYTAVFVATLLILTMLSGQSISGMDGAAAPLRHLKPAKAVVQRRSREVLVKFKPNVSEQAARSAVEKEGGAIAAEVPRLGVKKVEVSPGASPEEAAARFRSNPEVAYAQPNYIRHAAAVPNDTYYAKQWGPKKVGAEAAWNVSKGDGVIIAVVDTGVDYNHTDLAGKVIKGYNYVANTTDPMDDNGHGTHVAGEIAAVTDNSYGIAGMAWNGRILAVKVLDSTGSGNDLDIANGIRYAADNGAKVINLSLGGTGTSQVLDDAVVYARGQGAAVFAAAGNDGANEQFTPANSPGAVAVASLTNTTVRMEESAASPSGSWTPVYGAGYSGGQALQTSTSGATLTFYATGSAFALIGLTGPSGGTASVSVDSDTYAASFSGSFTNYQDKVIYLGGYSSGSHIVKIVANGNGAITVDALDLDQGSVARSSFSNYGSAIDVAAPGENMLSTYPGNRFAWGDGTSMACPMASGVAALAIAEFPTKTADQIERLVMETAGELGAIGRDDYYGYGQVDAASAVSSSISSVEESNSNVSYTGSWSVASNGGASGGSSKISGVSGASATLSLNGTSVNWVAHKGPDQGIATVYLDGASKGDVDLYSVYDNWQVLAIRESGLANTTHTIEIVVKGAKNAASTGSSVSVDAFDFSGYAVADTTPPTDPANLTVNRSGANLVLGWSPSTDAVGVSAYSIERRANQTNWSPIGMVTGNPPATAYSDIIAPADQNVTWYYRVQASDAAGNKSAYSNVASGSVPGLPPSAAPVNDADGDGLSDAVGFYDYGGATTGAWIFRTMPGAANPAGLTFSPSAWWRSGAGALDLSRVKLVTGDFDGDGKKDVIGLYNYGGTTSALLRWQSTGASFAGPTRVFLSNGWDWNKTKLVAGDFNGDGKDELFAFYNYGGTNTGVFVFQQNSDGTFQYPKLVFYSSYWSWDNTRLLSVKDQSTGISKVLAAYNYGETKTGLWVFELNPDGTLKYPALSFISNYWYFPSSTFLTGDVDGDGKDDVIAFYNYGGTKTGVFTFKATGQAGAQAFAYPVFIYSSPYWDYARSTFLPGDFNGDGRADAAAVYDYGGGKTGIWVFTSNGTSLSSPVMIYSTPYWNNAVTTWVMPY
ncbi:MAG: S8 family serine peptidase [Chloroflexi bacterium]|nr:S8 family serine peptidase [Chloroflexota bacterium]